MTAKRPSSTCGNEDGHTFPVRARWSVEYPDGRFNRTTACAGCVQFVLRQARDEGRPVLLTPITKGSSSTGETS